MKLLKESVTGYGKLAGGAVSKYPFLNKFISIGVDCTTVAN